MHMAWTQENPMEGSETGKRLIKGDIDIAWVVRACNLEKKKWERKRMSNSKKAVDEWMDGWITIQCFYSDVPFRLACNLAEMEKDE